MTATPHMVLLVEPVAAEAHRLRELLATTDRLNGDAPSFRVVHAHDLAGALASPSSLVPDAVLLDLSAQPPSAATAPAAILERWPNAAVLALIGPGDTGGEQAALAAGAHDCLLRDDCDGRLLRHSLTYAIERARLTGELRVATQRIATGESQVRTLIDTVADGVLVLDSDGTTRFANPAALSLFGQSWDQVSGRSLDVPVAVDRSAEIEIHHPDGTVRAVELRAAPTLWNEQPAWLVSLRDVTERKHAEEALRESEERYRRIVETASEGILAINSDERITFVDRRLAEMLGYTPEELLGQPATLLIFPDDIAEHHARTDERRQGIASRFERRLRRKDGSECWVITSGTPIQDTHGHFVGSLSMHTDITARRQAEQALRESEERYRRIVETANEGIWLVDTSGLTIYVNNRMAEMLGYTPAEMLGHPVTDFVFPEERADVERALRDRARGLSERFERRHRRKDGSACWMLISGSPLVDSTGQFVGSLAMFTNITERKRAEQMLQRERDVIARLAETSPAGLITLDPTGRITFANAMTERVLGLSREVITQRTHNAPEWVITDYDGRPFPDAELPFNRVMATGQPVYDVRHAIQGPDGRRRLLSVNAAPLRDANGTVDGVVATLQDITDQIHTQQALRASEEKYRHLIQHAPAGIYEIDFVNLRLTSVNDVICEYTGYSREELLALNPLDLLTDDSRAHFFERMQKIAAGETVPASVELRMRGKHGREMWVLLNAAWRTEGGRIVGATVVAHDITVRRQVEDELRRREALLQKVLEILPIGLWIADDQGRLQIANPAGVRIWGGRPLVGQEEYHVFKARRLPSGEEVAPDDWALVHTVREGVTIKDELLEIDAFDGVKRLILNYTAPVLNDRGQVEAAIVVNQDVTERIRAEEARERLQAQLLQAQKIEAVGRLTAGIAHDFNNLLTAIIGFSGLIQSKLLPGDPLHEYVAKVLESSQTAANLVQQLLAFSRQQARQLKILDVGQVVAGMERMLRRIIGEHIALHTHLPPDLWSVEVDPTQLQQAIINLAVNARDAMPRGGHLTIATANVTLDDSHVGRLKVAHPGDYVQISVRDTGHGISPEVLPHLFEPFFTTKEPGKGTGLGLATVYGIVQQSSGSIGVESTPGDGATFTIYLPRVDAPAQTTAAADPTAVPGGSETILLAEDNPGVRTLAREMLRQLGYTVLEAGDGLSGLELAAQHPGAIHLLITDLVMPGMGGVELAERLTAIHPSVKVLFMSGYSEEVTAEQGMPHAGAAFIQKPFKIHELALAVRQVLEAA